jgi:cytoskeletal protein RodZ
MDLSKFGEELKKLRLEKQVSLMDISFSTRINIKFLEAIEAGKFSVLPQTYVRAFLREYLTLHLHHANRCRNPLLPRPLRLLNPKSTRFHSL